MFSIIKRSFLSKNSNIDEWLNVLTTLIGPKIQKKRSWFKRVESSQAEGDATRPIIWEAILARDVLDDICSKCVEQEASIHCLKCMGSFCQHCDDSVHSASPFHDRLHNGNFFVPLERLHKNNEVITAGRTFI